MDFVADELDHGGKFRSLTVVDVFTRQALALEVGSRLKGEHVIEVLKVRFAERSQASPGGLA